MTALTSARESPSTWLLKFPLPAEMDVTLNPCPSPWRFACVAKLFDQPRARLKKFEFFYLFLRQKGQNGFLHVQHGHEALV
jgi:hypothetical protein